MASLSPAALQEVTCNSAATVEMKVTASACRALALHRIDHVGWVETPAPYRRVRLRPGGSFVLVCIAGEGRILLDGRWQRCLPGMACLAPPRVPNAFHALPSQPWRFCWVRYSEPTGTASVVSAGSPVKTQCNPTLLFSAIQGLQAELADAGEARLLHHWVELIHGAVQRLARPWQVHERLSRVWSAVESDLAHDWSSSALARLAHCSTEHLRRLCLRELGRTPLQQVTFMRVQSAAELLQRGDEKLAQIAEQLGYSDAFVLSRIFKRWIGCTPSAFRQRSEARRGGEPEQPRPPSVSSDRA